MAKEQKAIAKLLMGKDVINFFRFPIKNKDKILKQVVELYATSLSTLKDDLKFFDKFAIFETESDGTIIDTIFECDSSEFLNMVKEFYKERNGVYPSEDKFDSERWSYIIDGHKNYKESKKSIKESVVYRSDVKTILDMAKKLKCHKGLIEDLTAIYEIQSTSDDWEIIDICENYGELELLKFAKKLLGLKEGKKTMKKSITEKFNAPKDWDFDEMVEEYGEEYLNEVSRDWEDYVHDMDDLEYYLEKEDLNWLLNRMYNGGQYYNGDFHTKDTFDPNEEYYVVNGYGNFYSLSEYDKDDFIKDKIESLDNGEESFYDWCVEQGYFESEEDDE